MNDHGSNSDRAAPADCRQCASNLLGRRIWENCLPRSTSSFPTSSLICGMKSGEIRRFLNVYVNEEDIRFLGGNKYAFQDGDEVLLVPSIAGGAAKPRFV